MRIRISRGFLASGFGMALCAALASLLLIAGGIGAYYWISYGRMIDRSMGGHIRQSNARIYSAPGRITDGDALTAPELASELQRAGYGEAKTQDAPGWYSLQENVMEIRPQRDSYFAGKNALRVEFAGGKVRAMRLLDDGTTVETAQIEPELVSNLFDSSREKRRRVRFEDIPPVLVDAVLSAEDKRFFEHHGFDMIRILGAAWADVRHDAKAQGASTLTMQVARSLFFTTERTWRRKLAETTVSLELERRYSKQQIFELYANEIYLGNRGSFAIHGFAEGSLAYFNKDIRDLSLNEAAFLAGIIRAPNRYSTADRRPERAAEARDRVLNQMAENGFITPAQARDAKRDPLHLAPGGTGNTDAPYFVDMVKDHLLDHFSETELLSESFRVYTTLEPNLERAAEDAASAGIANVDKLLTRRYARWKKQGHPAEAQVAVIVLDPHTGEIRAVVGGRDYGQSQLNHALARRQPGSVFKPFVYAAAFDDAVQGVAPVVTPATTVVDEPTAFDFDGKEYTPNNYGEDFHGTVTLRDALTLSLNVATVKVAELVGYGRVVDMARQLGMDPNIQATPAVALGAYEMTPLEVSAAYTVFANAGVRAEPLFIDRVVSAEGVTIERGDIHTRPALDPRVAYQVTSILEDVVNHGTGASVRARGFEGPAAGKTGTSRDGWFAGYTSNLLCIVWVGFDDNRDLDLSGSATAAPIWADFMKRATVLPAYHDLEDFPPPEGMTVVEIDPETLELATPSCPVTRPEVFISGTEPTQFCEKHGGRMMTESPPASWLSRIFGGKDKPDEIPDIAGSDGPAPPRGKVRLQQPIAKAVPPASEPPESPGAEKKKGVFGRIFGIFGGSKTKQDKTQKSAPDSEP